ncbi:MAG: NYN domain-containing protein [Lentisphaeria bacterium]|nr:NYN domain-containing protein [Lentisphaeria bacterium]
MNESIGGERLAVLIDADNATAAVVDELLKEVAKYGTATVKRAYGDWTTTNLKSWKTVLHRHAIQPEQQFAYTRGKNATDSAMIIDAMDLLYSKNFTGFCIVSSDSDFTRLATRIRQDGLLVFGFGEKKTPAPFIAACDKFIFLEVLKPSPSRKPRPKKKKEEEGEASSVDRADLIDIVSDAVAAVAKDDGWAALSAVGSYISKNNPSFDSRNHGFPRLGELIESLEFVDAKYLETGGHKNMHVRLKSRSR